MTARTNAERLAQRELNRVRHNQAARDASWLKARRRSNQARERGDKLAARYWDYVAETAARAWTEEQAFLEG